MAILNLDNVDLKSEDVPKIANALTKAILSALIVFAVLSSNEHIGTGCKGVVFRFGKHVRDLNPGMIHPTHHRPGAQPHLPS
jgi:hypothetical protein